MYKILFHKEVTKDLKSITLEFIESIKIAINERLSTRPYDFKPLSGTKYKGLYRLRISHFRIIYRILEDKNSVLILVIGHRREIYDRLGRKS